MILLIQYNRPTGRIVSRQTFADADREIAQTKRLDLELELKAEGIEDEVVLLEAVNEELLHRTHRRYFEDLRELTSYVPDPDSQLLHSR